MRSLRVRDIIGATRQLGVSGGRVLHVRVSALALKVGLRAEVLDRFAHEFFGGQRQRIGIARALVLNAGLIAGTREAKGADGRVKRGRGEAFKASPLAFQT